MKIFNYQKTVFIILHIILCCDGDLKAGYRSIQYGYKLLYRMIESYVNYSILDCVEECLRTKRCKSVNYYKGANFCEINFENNISLPELYQQASNWLYTDIKYWNEALAESCAGSGCEINEKCVPKPFGHIECVLSDCGIPVDIIKNTTWNVQKWEGIGIRKRMHIKCLDSFEQRGSGMIMCHKNGTWITDLVCQVRADCKDLHKNGHTNSDVYEIYPYGTDTSPIKVFCDMNTYGGGWTVIQKRVDGSLDFDRDWTEYKNGFGKPEQDVWIGNDVIHQLTKGNNSSIFISITLENGTTLYELYETFVISDETEKYKLFLAGTAEGTLGDSMMNTGYRTHDLSGMYFSTKNRDNDQNGYKNCAAFYKGGWWFNACYLVFLNGPWSNNLIWIWYPKIKYGTSVKETLMMIRRH